MATPQVPPRPARSQPTAPDTSHDASKMPQIPPRPARKAMEESISQNRENLTRSPLNDPPGGMTHGTLSQSIYGRHDHNGSSSSLSLPHRPPSVSLPSIGQEGQEYGDLGEEDGNTSGAGDSQPVSPTHTRNIGNDLPLHAPKPSLSNSDAKARVQGVTRTDSSKSATTATLSKVASPPDPYHQTDLRRRSLRNSVSFDRTSSAASTERPGSAQNDQEQGIPEIGIRVPMYPNAGDVQAPSPSPFGSNPGSGIGFHNNDPFKSRHHGRTRSGREVFHGPPGSYGLHGHHGHGGVAQPDKFEKAWYEKHPDEFAKHEQGQYGPAIGERPEWALSSDDLNKLVRDSASRGAGFGTTPDVVSMPNEQIGYMASEEYASRISSRPSTSSAHKPSGSLSVHHTESPLRQAVFPDDALETDNLDLARVASKNRSRALLHASSEDEGEHDDNVIHIGEPEYKTSKVHGNGYDPPTEDLGPRGGNTEDAGGWIEERGTGTPILASDEVAKERGHEYMQPAIPPAQTPRDDESYSRLGFKSASNSRPGSRPGSIHGMSSLSRFTSHDDRADMHTPLDDVEEYEPLFPEEEEAQKAKEAKAQTLADRFKARPNMKQRFPSQDIWEDTPNSLQLQTEVETPEPKEDSTSDTTANGRTSVFETPEMEQARKGEVDEAERSKLVPKEERLAKSHFKPHLIQEMARPNMRQRFPSSDIWEDSPDSARLETTVGSVQDEEALDPSDEGVKAGAIVHTTAFPIGGQLAGDQERAGATAGAPASSAVPSIPPRPTKADNNPQIPPRPNKTRQPPVDSTTTTQEADVGSPSDENKPISPSEARKQPLIPERPKPQIPARPARTAQKDSSEGTPLTKTTSIGSNDSSTSRGGVVSPPPVSSKPKPSIPARPAGNKIAALQGAFMGDLEKRLRLGPQAPPKAQEKSPEREEAVAEEDKGPLSDARKGRARGPARRKPAASPSAPATEEKSTSIPPLSFSQPLDLWHVSPEDGIFHAVHAKSLAENDSRSLKDIESATANIPSARTTEDSASDKDAPLIQPQIDTSRTETTGTSANEDILDESTASTTRATKSSGTHPIDDVSDDRQAPTPVTSSLQSEPTSAEAQSSPEISHASVQTGQKDILIGNSSTGPVEKLTAYEDGSAHAPGHVIVREEGVGGEDNGTDVDGKLED